MAIRAEGRRLSRDRFRPGRRRSPAVAARHRSDRRVSGARCRPGGPSGRFHDPRRRDRRARRCDGASLVQSSAESARAEDASGDRSRATRSAGRDVVLRPAAFRGHQPARLAVHRSASLSVAMLADHIASAAGAHDRQCGEALRCLARQRLRRHRRQAQGQHVSARQAHQRVAQDQGDADGGVRRRRLHEREGRARSSRLAAARLLERQQAALRRSCRVRSGRPRHRGAGQALSKTRAQGAAVRRKAAAATADHMDRSRAGRRSDVRRMDAGRHVARTGLPARARRHRVSQHQGRTQGEARQAGAAGDAAERSGRGAAAAGEQVEPHRPRGRRRKDPPHESRPRVLARRSRKRSNRR